MEKRARRAGEKKSEAYFLNVQILQVINKVYKNIMFSRPVH